MFIDESPVSAESIELFPEAPHHEVNALKCDESWRRGRQPVKLVLSCASNPVTRGQDAGPNHGLAYLKEVPMQPTAIVVIHPALTRGSAFYRAQAQTSNVVHGTPPCVQSRWDEYVRLVEEHEGLHGNPNSHVGFFEAALNPTAAETVEHVVGRVENLASMAQEWQELLNPVAARALAQSSNELFHKAPGGLVRFGCEFNFDVRGR